jgi:hypothetical protein
MTARGNVMSTTQLKCDRCGKIASLNHDGSQCDCGGMLKMETLQATSAIYSSPTNKTRPAKSKRGEKIGANNVVRLK